MTDAVSKGLSGTPQPGTLGVSQHGAGVVITIGTPLDRVACLLPAAEAERIADRIKTVAATAQGRSAAAAAQAVEASRG